MKTYIVLSLEHSNNNQRMHPTLKLIMWMSVFLLIFTVENVYSQADTLNCSTSDSCNAIWSNPIAISRNLGSGITAVIWYRKRICNGIDQIIIDSSKAYDNGNFMDSINRYEYRYKAFNDLVDLYMLQSLYNGSGTPFDNENPVDSTKIVSQIYKQICGVWLRCEYIVNPSTVNCDNGFDLPMPNQNDTLKVYQWQPCGFVCCKKTYEIYRTNQTLNDGSTITIVKIKHITTGRSKYTPDCTLQPMYDEPCQDGC